MRCFKWLPSSVNLVKQNSSLVSPRNIYRRISFQFVPFRCVKQNYDRREIYPSSLAVIVRSWFFQRETRRFCCGLEIYLVRADTGRERGHESLSIPCRGFKAGWSIDGSFTFGVWAQGAWPRDFDQHFGTCTIGILDFKSLIYFYLFPVLDWSQRENRFAMWPLVSKTRARPPKYAWCER